MDWRRCAGATRPIMRRPAASTTRRQHGTRSGTKRCASTCWRPPLMRPRCAAFEAQGGGADHRFELGRASRLVEPGRHRLCRIESGDQRRHQDDSPRTTPSEHSGLLRRARRRAHPHVRGQSPPDRWRGGRHRNGLPMGEWIPPEDIARTGPFPGRPAEAAT